MSDAALESLAGCDYIIHAGDIGGDDIILALEALSTLIAVRGNTDERGLAANLPHETSATIDGYLIAVRHFPWGVRPDSARADVYVSGHTHRASCVRESTTIRVDPGSASRPRGGSRPTLALLSPGVEGVRIRIVEI